MSIAPLETRYAGCRFRSRLEARWAVFFNTLGIEWEYEPQGYTVGPDKRPYLPDFLLPELDAFVEVKGDTERLDAKLLVDLTRNGRSSVPFTLVLGPVPTMEIGSVPTHALFMPTFDFYGSAERPGVPETNKAFAALEKLDEDDRAAVNGLIKHGSRQRIVCHRAFFTGGRANGKVCWGVMPFGIPLIDPSAELILNPGSVWQVIPHPRIKTAYEAARSARFEHGEQG